MNQNTLSPARVRQILSAATKTRVLVVGDVMLDQFIWGTVARISPEAPVPVVDFQRESFMPGGAANVARNLVALGANTELFGIIGQDATAAELNRLLSEQKIGCAGLFSTPNRHTTMKTRVVANRQQVVRIDRETRQSLTPDITNPWMAQMRSAISKVDAVIVGDYGKGVVSNSLLIELRRSCSKRAIWLTLDPKPVHGLVLKKLPLITPNRREAFELARLPDETRNENPFEDENLMRVAERLLNKLQPTLLLITLGELGMLLCQRGRKPFHIPTVAQEVFDVSGAGDTVISTFTLAIAAGASPIEAAIFSNHAAGIVVGKVGTATTSPEELLKSFSSR